MTRISFRLFLAVPLVACLIAVPALAQKITGDIAGSVDDPTGAVVAGATVKAENPLTGFSVSATSNESGSYRIVGLAPGTYKVSATASGFKTVQRDVTVAISTVTTSNFHMVVGAEGESITVEASAPLVETTENRQNTVIDARRIEDLPTSGRDFNSLLESVPGVQRVAGGGFLSVNINGQRATSNNFAVDGIPNNDRYYGETSLNQVAIAGTAATLVPLEGITEFTVQSNPSAEYGVRGGSVINVALKSGTNNLHGQAFWFRHTDFADAKNFFTAPGAPIPPFRLNQFGGILGGPIKKDKTFFMISYQGFRLSNSFAYEADVPTPGEIAAANFCVSNGAVEGMNGVIDTTGYVVGVGGFPEGDDCLVAALQGLGMGVMAPGPGNDQIFLTGDDGIPNTIGTNLLAFYPIDPAGFITVNSPNTLTVDGFHVKLDHIFNDRHRLSAKYLFGDSVQSQPAFSGQLVPPAAAGPPDLFNSVAPSRSMLAGVNWTWTISPTKLLESRVGYQRFSQIIDVNNKIDPVSLGIDTGPLDPLDFGVPGVYYMGYFGYIGGVAGYPITTAPDASYDLQEHFTWTKGNHIIKIGGQYQNAYTKSLRNRARTLLDIALTGEHVPALTQLLTGLFDGAGRSFGDSNRRISQDSYGFYFMDTWKLRPNLTLEYGVRYDISTALEEEQGRGDNFLPGDPLADANGFVPLSARALHAKDKDNFGPRLGLAWDIGGRGKTVLRGGYSLSYDVPNFGTIHAPQVTGIFPGSRAGLYTNPPHGVVAVSQEQSTPADNQVVFAGNTFCQDFLCVSPTRPIFGANPTTTLASNPVQIVTDFRTPIYHAFNLTLQQEINSKTAFSLAYVGGAGEALPSWRDLNASPVGSATVGCDQTTDDDLDGDPDDFQDRPFFGAFGTTICHVVQLNNDGYSRYHSVQASLSMRNWHNLTGQTNFTWGVSRDTGSHNRGSFSTSITPFQNPYCVECNYAFSDHDVEFNFNLSLLYDVPAIQALPKVIGEGWQINNAFAAVSGRPFTPHFNPSDSGHSGQGLGVNRADYNGGQLNYDYSNPSAFFDTSVFSLPADGVIGNAARNMLRGPGFHQWDMSIFKSTKIGERFTVQFRWEVFNILNHPNFSVRTGNIESSSFGQYRETPDIFALNAVLGKGAQRNMQFGLKFIF